MFRAGGAAYPGSLPRRRLLKGVVARSNGVRIGRDLISNLLVAGLLALAFWTYL